MTTARPLDVLGSLRGERIFITGATGFVGKVLVERLLSSVPEVGRLLLLIRPSRDHSAEERLRREVLDSPIMARLRALHGNGGEDGWEAWAASRVEVVAGDLAAERFGLAPERYAALCRGVDRVVASAATVTFDERLDRAVELNARGAQTTLELARDAGNVPLVHVSTCFVSGRRTGPVAEGPVEPDPGSDGGGDLDSILASIDDACQRLASDDPADPGSDRPWVAAGTELARRHGFHDVYTFTKALGERLLTRHRGAVPLAIVRPAIVESAAAQPIAGWIETIRVTDPLLVAYGRGRTRELPGAASVPLELIPVDYVVHAMMAALAELPARPETAGEILPIRVYQVGSSRNPITLGELMTYAREGFARTPLRDEGGEPIPLREARLVEPERLHRALEARLRRARRLARRSGQRHASRQRAGERTLEHFIRLLEVYRPYLSGGGASYEDEATRRLWERLPADQRALLPFDVAALDWRSYIAETHVPGLVRFALKAETWAPPPTPEDEPRAALPAEDLAAATTFDLFAAVAQAAPETLAFQTFRHGRWLRYLYGQALTATANVARGLAGRYAIGRGDRVVLWASGSPEWMLTLFAIHRLGAVVVPLDPQWPAGEAVRAARLVGAKLICAAPGLLPGLAEALAGEPVCPVVALAAPFVPEPDVGLLPVAPAAPESAADAGDLALIVFTSGTTVSPKAVPLTHANLLANVRDLVPLMRLSGERLLSVLPVHHVFELMVGLLVPLAGGSSFSYVAELKPAEISWMMTTTRPTVLVAVPRLLELLHNGIRQSVAAGGPMLGRLFRLLFVLSKLTGGRRGHRLFGKVHRRFGGSLRRIATGGSALEPSLGRSFQLMGFRVAEGYGMTETSPVLTVNPWDAIRFGSVGKPLPGVEVELRPLAVDAAAGGEHAAASDGGGEIWVRGANVMVGYYQNPAATAEVMADGWLNTGDVGRFDADGYLWLSGRTKDVIVTAAGKNVYPEEVELRYRDLPGIAGLVQELVVLGLPAGDGSIACGSGAGGSAAGAGERVCALVVPRAGASAEEVESIRAAIATRSADVPSYQRVSRVEIWRGDLPKTTTMKVKRSRLRDAVLAGQRGTAQTPAPPSAPQAAALDETERWMLATVARLTRTRPDLLGPTDRLDDLGVDSLTRVELVGEIEARFGLRLDDETAARLSRVGDLFKLAPPAGDESPA